MADDRQIETYRFGLNFKKFPDTSPQSSHNGGRAFDCCMFVTLSHKRSSFPCRQILDPTLTISKLSNNNNNNNNNNSHDNVYGAVIMTQSHCESSPGLSDECRLSAGWPPTLRPSQSTWAVSKVVTNNPTTICI